MSDDTTEQASATPGSGGAALWGLVPLGAGQAAQGPGAPRGLLCGPLRVEAVPTFLQDLHREGVGRARVGALRRLGRPAGEGSLPVPGAVGGHQAEVAE